MRRVLSMMLGCCCLTVAAGCDPPVINAPVRPADVKSVYVPPPLPDAVVATVTRLREIAANGSYRDMARMAEETPGFQSNAAGMSHADYWYLMLRTGDWPMAQAERLFGYPYAVEETGAGRVYIWPRMATLRSDQITPAVARNIDRLLGEGHAAGIKAGEPWPGYILGIAEDGRWLYFMTATS